MTSPFTRDREHFLFDSSLQPSHSNIMSSLSTIQLALALEASANIFGATLMLLFPHPILTSLTSSSTPSLTASSPNPSPASIQLLQYLAAIVYGLTPQLLLALPNQKGARDKRWTAYMTLGAGEGALIAVMLWQALRGEEVEGGLTRRALGGCVGALMPFMVWRGWVLGVRPEVLGEGEVGGKRA